MSTPLGCRHGPSPGRIMDEAGLRKKKGFFGFAFFSSAMWSLIAAKY